VNMEGLIRRIWVVVTNSVMIYLVWPRSSAVDQLNRAIGNASSVPILTTLREHPGLTIAAVVLASGIIVEFFNLRLAAILNVGYYGLSLCIAIWGITRDWHEVPTQRIYMGMTLYTVPVLVILLANLYFYRKGLTHRRSEAAAI
jgi:hypothetical protein